MVNKPQFQLYALRGAFGSFRDDNFYTGWTGAATASTDGDLYWVQNGTKVKTTQPLLTNTYNVLTVRADRNTATTLTITVSYVSGTPESLVIDNTSANGVYTMNLTAGRTISTVSIVVTATGALYGIVDWIYITAKTYLDLTSYLTGYNTRHGLGWQVGEANFTLRDEAGLFWKSPNQLMPADIIIFYENVAASGTGYKRAWGGPLRTIRKRSGPSGTRWSTLVVQDWNKALEAVETNYFPKNLSDTTIVGAFIDAINTGRINANISGWNLAKDITGYTTANMIFNWQNIDVKQALSELSDYTAIQIVGRGVDFTVTHSELFRYKQIGSTGAGNFLSYTYTDSDVSLGPISTNLDYDIFDTRTAVTVIGTVRDPADGDQYTENDATNWAATLGVISDNATTPQIGSKSIRHLMTAGQLANAQGVADRTLNNPLDLSAVGLGAQFKLPYLNVFWRIGSNVVNSGGTLPPQINLKSTSGVAQWVLPASLQQWQNAQIPLGPNAPSYRSTLLAPGLWALSVPFNWNDVKTIEFSYSTLGVADANTWMDIDGFYLTGNAAETAVDSRGYSTTNPRGEAQLGRRELIIYDPTQRPLNVPVGNANGPGLRQAAYAELLKWRDPIISGRITFDITTNNLANVLPVQPGDTIILTNSHYNFTSKAFRVVNVSHRWQTPADHIVVEFEITDFFVNTMSRSARDINRQLAQHYALSNLDYQQARFQSYILYGGLTPTVTPYSDAIS